MKDEVQVINYDEIKSAATFLGNSREKIEKTLSEFNRSVQELGTVWTGEAATKTKNIIEDFSSKYKSYYQTKLNNNIEFLNKIVLEKGYVAAEDENTARAEEFK